jgi:hypothetical protein
LAQNTRGRHETRSLGLVRETDQRAQIVVQTRLADEGPDTLAEAEQALGNQARQGLVGDGFASTILLVGPGAHAPRGKVLVRACADRDARVPGWK